MEPRQIPFSPPDISEEEIEEVADTLRSGWITTGPKTKKFEKEIADFCHTKKAVCLNSSTAAMEMTLRLFGIGPGDEVITSAYTYTATASAIVHTGAKPVLIDVQPGSYEMDYEAVKNDKILKIAEETRECFQPSENKYQKAMGRIMIMADSAHGFGAVREGKVSGEMADFTTFSFHAVKNLTTAEGGAVVWKEIPGVDSEEIYRDYMLLSLHGQSKDALAKTKAGAWEYDILSPAYKCNMTDIMASIGLVQFRRYPGMLARRKDIVKRYEKGLDKINQSLKDHKLTSLIHYNDMIQSSGHLFLMRITSITPEQRNLIIQRLAEKGVAVNVHYKPLPLLTAYKTMGFDIKDYPNAYEMFANEITLPLHTKLSDDDVAYVLECLEEVLHESL